MSIPGISVRTRTGSPGENVGPSINLIEHDGADPSNRSRCMTLADDARSKVDDERERDERRARDDGRNGACTDSTMDHGDRSARAVVRGRSVGGEEEKRSEEVDSRRDMGRDAERYGFSGIPFVEKKIEHGLFRFLRVAQLSLCPFEVPDLTVHRKQFPILVRFGYLSNVAPFFWFSKFRSDLDRFFEGRGGDFVIIIHTTRMAIRTIPKP